MNNKENLHDKNIISDFEYQSAVDQLLSAKASLAQAQAQFDKCHTEILDFCTVTSPSNGVVGTFPYRVGSLVSPSVAQPLTTVSEIGDMYVYFSMTEKQLLAMTKAGGTLKDQLEKIAGREIWSWLMEQYMRKRVELMLSVVLLISLPVL